MKKFKKVKTKKTYQFGKWYRVDVDEVVTPSGAVGEYNIVKQADFPVIIPIDEKGNIYFTKFHRYTTDFVSIELPAGHSDGDEILDAAKRELREETGLEASSWKKIGDIHIANGIAAITAIIFVAKNIKKVGSPIEMEDESIDSILKLNLNQAKNFIATGKIKDDITISAIAKAEYSGELF